MAKIGNGDADNTLRLEHAVLLPKKPGGITGAEMLKKVRRVAHIDTAV
ncbi:hypothetical protein LBMAG47_19630 [Planctomycetia bacterium]|nr:hypothetical protein LBMAG47_19630 [Planctomycetia bacterium]